MTRKIPALVLLGLFAGGPLVVGCDKTVSEKKSTQTNPDGSTSTSKEKTTQSPDGTVKTETEKTRNP